VVALNIARLLLVCALGVDLFLAGVSWGGRAVAGCGPESNCHTVLSSPWAFWLGLPVSWPAALVYAIALVATLRLHPDSPPASRRKAWLLLIPSSTLIITAGLWFVFLQLFVLKTICPFCMAAHGCALAGTGLLLVQAPVGRVPVKDSANATRAFVPAPVALGLVLGALLAVSLLIAGQVLRPRRSYLITPIRAGVRTNPPQSKVRTFAVLDGQFQFNLDEVPLMGRPEAAQLIVSLFDYTCDFCRELHGPIVQAHRQFSNQLAVISLPIPLDARCNPVVRRTLPAHTNACALARLGLTVWLADRQAAVAFDEWMFLPPQPPSPEAAERYARQLVGEEKFNAASTNRWIDLQIQQNVALYKAIYRQYGKSHVPEILIGTNLMSGVFTSAQFFQVLGEQLGLGR
jgi:uncharacterized membrane protein